MKPEHAHAPVPVTIPTLVLDVAEDGTLTAALDGQSLHPPAWAPPWRRADFPQIIDQASKDRTVPVRVEVREADGVVFTDLITARPRHSSTPVTDAVPEPASRLRKHAARPVFHEVDGDGFVPGEDVAIAIITGHTDATHTGATRALIDPQHLVLDASGATSEVLLLGRVSGTAVFRRLS